MPTRPPAGQVPTREDTPPLMPATVAADGASLHAARGQDADLEADAEAADWAARADGGVAGDAADAGEGGQARAATDRALADRVVTAAAFFFYVVVFASVAAMSYRGLMAFAVDTLGLHGGWRYVVPVSLDGAAVSASFFGYRASIDGEPAFGPRLLVFCFGGASAFFNGHEAAAERGPLAAAFYAGMSVLVVLMFDLGAKQIRRRALARQGKLEAPLPRFRLARWLLAPVETFGALRIAALESDLTADQAVRFARTRRIPAPAARSRPASSSEPGAVGPVGSAQPSAAATADSSATAPAASSRTRRVDPGSAAGNGGPDQGPDKPTSHTADHPIEPESARWTADADGGGRQVSPDEHDAGHRDASARGGAEARLTALAMLQSAVTAELPLTGREVSDRVGCHVGEGRKLLREARLQHLQGQLSDAARRGAEMTAEDVMTLYQVRVDHAGRLLSDARHAMAAAGAVPAVPPDDPPGRDDEGGGGTRQRLVAAS